MVKFEELPYINWIKETSEPFGLTVPFKVTVVPDTVALSVVTKGVEATVNEKIAPELLPFVLLAESLK